MHGGGEDQLRGFFRARQNPHWTGSAEWDEPQTGNGSGGQLSEELRSELLIWRPLLAGHVSLGELRGGVVTLDDLLKLNALLDMRAQQHAAARREQMGRNRTDGTARRS
ncbi:Hypothetical protein GbCGDNIH6_5064 [Granulibacter bethesdensis]|nr:Hypothetical protein GbCGDNIH6_5064 [Granulibacter bethesdensis]